MRKFLLLFAFISLAYVGVGQIISQYIETDSGTEPKGIEIWNNTASTLDFSVNNLVIEKGTNGGVPSEDFTLDAGTLSAGDVIVIGTADLQTITESNGSVFHEKSFNFNGDDALVVKYGGTISDVFGEPEVDPGSAWSGNSVSTENQNISLVSGITTGDIDGWTDPSSRFETISTSPSGANGDEGFGIAPVSGGNASPSITNIAHSPENVSSSDNVSVSADITDSDGSIGTAELHWGTVSGNLSNTISMSNTSGDTYTANSDIPAQAVGITVFYQIYAVDNNSAETTSPEQSYLVQDFFSLPFTDDFSQGLYEVTLGGEGSNGTSDYFFTTDGSDISPEYSGISGNFFAGQDINDGGWTGSDSPSQLTWSNIDASGVSNLTFSCDFASEGGGIDDGDFLLFEYRVDGGSWIKLISFENTGGTNNNFYEDTDFDGTGDGTQLSSTFSSFTKEFSISGSIIDIRFTADLDSGGEEFAIDNVSLSEVTTLPEPTNHVASFSASENSYSQIDLTWSDNDGTQAADGFLIKANTSGTFTDPSDGTDPTEDTDLSDGAGLVKVSHGVETYSFTNLNASTQYFFKIWPYTNEGTDIDFKTNGTVPTANATTGAAPVTPELIISEVADPGDDYTGRFVELFNAGSAEIDFSSTTVYFSRQANGGNHSSIQLTGTIAPHETYIIGNSSDIITAYGFSADLDFGSVTGNGDDGYFLYYDGDETTGTLMDAYGVIGVDGTDEEWEYEDSKAVRKNSVTSPSDTWTATEWNIISNCNTTSMTPAMYPITTWNGGSAKSNDWSTEGNWDNGLPGNGISVFIPSGLTTYPTILSSATIKDVILEGGATLVGQENLTVNGNIYVKRSYTAYSSTSASDGWYVVSSPVNGMAITGSDFEPGANDDLYEYDESNNMWLNYTGGTFGDNSFVAGKGYLISSETTEMKSFEGSDFNADGISATLGETNTKWNLVGNPYPSKLTYANINVSNVSSPKTLNESTGAWEDIGAEVDVAEGIFVYAEGSSSLTFNLDDQTHGSAKKVTQNYAYLRANFDDGLSVFARFGTDASASQNYEWKYDARYLYPATSIPYLSTITGDDVMASTYVFNEEEESIIVPLYFSVNTEREISFSTEGNIGYQLAIEDNIDGSITEIDANNPFVFTALPADATNRFNLHLTKASTIGLDEHEELAGVHVYANKRNIYFNTDEKLTNATLTVYNTIGQVVLTTEVETGSEIIRMENRGAYIVKVQSNEGRMTEKIIIK